MINVYATCVEMAGSGVLLRGPPGSGKSDLALRIVDGGGRLVADDQTLLRRVGEAIVASAPASIAGRIEARGIGILAVPSIPEATVRLVVDMVSPSGIERLPEPGRCRYLDCTLPLIAVAPFEASAAAKIRFALGALASRGEAG
jgi:HPr kinase/phosphorylase